MSWLSHLGLLRRAMRGFRGSNRYKSLHDSCWLTSLLEKTANACINCLKDALNYHFDRPYRYQLGPRFDF